MEVQLYGFPDHVNLMWAPLNKIAIELWSIFILEDIFFSIIILGIFVACSVSFFPHAYHMKYVEVFLFYSREK